MASNSLWHVCGEAWKSASQSMEDGWVGWLGGVRCVVAEVGGDETCGTRQPEGIFHQSLTGQALESQQKEQLGQ